MEINLANFILILIFISPTVNYQLVENKKNKISNFILCNDRIVFFLFHLIIITWTLWGGQRRVGMCAWKHYLRCLHSLCYHLTRGSGVHLVCSAHTCIMSSVLGNGIIINSCVSYYGVNNIESGFFSGRNIMLSQKIRHIISVCNIYWHLRFISFIMKKNYKILIIY